MKYNFEIINSFNISLIFKNIYLPNINSPKSVLERERIELISIFHCPADLGFCHQIPGMLA